MSDLTLQSTNIVYADSAGQRAQTVSKPPLPGPASSSLPSPRLVQAAHEFEASMMKELLAPLQSTQSALGSDEDADGSNSALTSFAGEALGKAISEHGGFGIAKSILHQLSSASNHFGNAPVTVDRNETAPKASVR